MHAGRFLLPICLLAVAIFPARLFAEDPLTPEQLDHVQWKFSSFLDGDSQKIRDTINGTLEQQLNRKAEKTKRIEDAKAAIAAKRDAAAEKLRASSPAFAKLQDDLTAAKTQAATARKSSDMVTMMSAQNNADQLQQKIDQQLDSALANDPEVAAEQKQIKDTQAELKNLAPAIVSATKARDQLVDGLRNSLKIPGPPSVGKQGLLGRVKPLKIIDAHSFTTDFEAVEVTGEDTKHKAADGFKNVTGKGYMIHLVVTGVDTAKMHVGTETILDHNFVITGTQPLGKGTAFVVAPSEQDRKAQAFDHLFDLLDELRVNGSSPG